MSRKLEELFGMPSAKSFETPEEETVDQSAATQEASATQALLAAADDAIDKIDVALPTVRDLDASDVEMDDIATLAQDTFKDLIDLSMNVEPRFSGPIIQSASTLLGHALTAKMAKMDKKLKMVGLQLQKAKLDQTERFKSQSVVPEEAAIEGKGMVMDRNALLQSILANSAKVDK